MATYHRISPYVTAYRRMTTYYRMYAKMQYDQLQRPKLVSYIGAIESSIITLRILCPKIETITGYKVYAFS